MNRRMMIALNDEPATPQPATPQGPSTPKPGTPSMNGGKGQNHMNSNSKFARHS